jgi:hypothetical protein
LIVALPTSVNTLDACDAPALLISLDTFGSDETRVIPTTSCERTLPRRGSAGPARIVDYFCNRGRPPAKVSATARMVDYAKHMMD